jgi:hypothetical protein
MPTNKEVAVLFQKSVKRLQKYTVEVDNFGHFGRIGDSDKKLNYKYKRQIFLHKSDLRM